MRLALFDLDGTLTKEDTFLAFIQSTHGKPRFYLGFLWLSPLIFLYKIRLLSNWKLKQAVLHYFYKGWSKEKLDQGGRKFALEVLPALILPDARERLRWHQAQKHRIYVISASCDVWLEAWCDKEGISLISTRLNFLNDIFSGKFGTPNCHGLEKVVRIKDEIKLGDFEYIYAYGNEPSDYPMLDLANEKYYCHFTK